jgi:hypothetical protein
MAKQQMPMDAKPSDVIAFVFRNIDDPESKESPRVVGDPIPT